jgi:hypothetical protein
MPENQLAHNHSQSLLSHRSSFFTPSRRSIFDIQQKQQDMQYVLLFFVFT